MAEEPGSDARPGAAAPAGPPGSPAGEARTGAEAPCGGASDGERRGAGVSDAVSQANVALLGSTPAFAVAMEMLQAAQASGVLFANMVQSQQQTAISGQAAAMEAVIKTLGPDR